MEFRGWKSEIEVSAGLGLGLSPWLAQGHLRVPFVALCPQTSLLTRMHSQIRVHSDDPTGT